MSAGAALANHLGPSLQGAGAPHQYMALPVSDAPAVLAAVHATRHPPAPSLTPQRASGGPPAPGEGERLHRKAGGGGGETTEMLREAETEAEAEQGGAGPVQPPAAAGADDAEWQIVLDDVDDGAPAPSAGTGAAAACAQQPAAAAFEDGPLRSAHGTDSSGGAEAEAIESADHANRAPGVSGSAESGGGPVGAGPSLQTAASEPPQQRRSSRATAPRPGRFAASKRSTVVQSDDEAGDGDGAAAEDFDLSARARSHLGGDGGNEPSTTNPLSRRNALVGRVPPLRAFIEAGLLVPGEGCLAVKYRDVWSYGDLLPDGSIESEGRMFQAPSSFSLAVKQQLNPMVSFRNLTFSHE